MSFARFIGLCALSISLFVAMTPTARADWYRVTTDNFIVYGEGSEREITREAERLERLDLLMRQAMNVPPNSVGNRLSVFLVDSPRELQKISPGISRNYGGYYLASSSGVYATLIRGEDNHTLFHEYAHHFMMHYFPGHYPGWFIEGFAEYFATANVRDNRQVSLGYFSEGRRYVLSSERWISTERLLSGRAREMGPKEGQLYYAQSWLLTHYLMSDTQRKRAFSAYLAALRRGADWKDALLTHVGMTPEQLEQALRSYFNGRMGYAEFAMEETKVQGQVTRLPDSAKDFIHSYAALQGHISSENAQLLLADARTKATRYPDDPLALTVLASLEQEWGDASRAEQALKHLLDLEPNHVDGLRVMAQLRMSQAKAIDDPDLVWPLMREAQQYLAKALAQDETDFRIYAHLATIRSGAEDYPNDNDLDTLAIAMALAPQVTSVRLQTVHALRLRGLNAQANDLMRVLRSQPHASPTSPDSTQSTDSEDTQDDEAEANQ